RPISTKRRRRILLCLEAVIVSESPELRARVKKAPLGQFIRQCARGFLLPHTFQNFLQVWEIVCYKQNIRLWESKKIVPFCLFEFLVKNQDLGSRDGGRTRSFLC